MILREYLYVDAQLVRGLLAQLDDGVQEQIVENTTKSKSTSAGAKGLLGHSQDWGDSSSITKSMADAAFPAGAEVLEVGCGTGVLTRVLAALPEVNRVVGVDIAESLLARARELAPGEGRSTRHNHKS